MRLLTCLLPGESRPTAALLVDGDVVPFAALGRTGRPATELPRELAPLGLRALLAADPGLVATRRAAEDVAGLPGSPGPDRRPLGEVRLLAPIPGPGKIVCIGQNYRRHIEEQGIPIPDRPTLFAKFANAVVGPDAPVVRHVATHALDLEAELAVVIGRRARRVEASTAVDHIAGYTVVNDISARDLQGQAPALREGEHGDGQWLRAKGSDTFLPMGPWLVTPDELPEGGAGLAVRSWRTPCQGPGAGAEQPMQEGRTDDLVWSVPDLVAFVSAVITLEPGDVIATGTPPGVGVWKAPPVFLEPGDVARVEVERIGTLRNPIVDADGAAPAGSPAARILDRAGVGSAGVTGERR